MTEHTPGPWKVQSDGNYHRIYDERNTQSVAEILPRWNQSEELPNARLIAAAPALLEACEELIQYYEASGRYPANYNKAVSMAREALAAARQEASR